MLEIFAIIFLSKKIVGLAEEKGESPKKWKGIMIGSWFGAEILGVILFAFAVGIDDENIFAAAITGLACGFISYLVVRTILSNKPEAVQKLSNEV